jgi:hypothetical protein
MARNWFLLSFALFTLGCAGSARGNPEGSAAGAQAESFDQVAGLTYRQRYHISDASQKLVNNQGDGFEALYGVRNFRAVLNGVYYRGGANNVYNKQGKRKNSNPLTNRGLENLCEEGFSQAVYLYPTNYSGAAKTIRCRDFRGNENVLSYAQVSPLSYRREDQRLLLNMINERVRDPRQGPIYDHCWNGWHASGFVAAITLRQFCDFTKEQAIAYWNKNTDGNNQGRNYDRVRNQIKAFEPFPDLSLTEAEKRILCPHPTTLNFQ